MKRLARYLKPYRLMIALALALLLAQVVCDLLLPTFMADIVNIGLQQSGVEHAAPDALTPERFAAVTAVMSGDDRALALASYRPISGGVKDGREYRAWYPALGTEISEIYIKDHVAPRDLPALDQAFERAAVLAAADGTTAEQAGLAMARAAYEELGMDITALQRGFMLRVGFWMLLVTLLGGGAAVLVGLLAPRVSAGVARDIRRDLFAKVESFSHYEFDRFSSASLITRCTNDVVQVAMLVGMGLRMMCFAPIMGIGSTVMALGRSVSMGWVIALAVIVLLGIIITVMVVAMPRFKIIQELVDKLNRVSRETLAGLTVIRAFGTQRHEMARFDAANAEMTGNNLFVQRVMVTMMPAISLVMNGVTLLIIWVGARQIAASAMQVGDMMAFIQYATAVIFSFMMISMMFVFVPRAAVSGERIAEVLDTEPSVRDPQTPKPFDNAQKGCVVFDGVHFRYPGAEADALSDVSFTAKPGETTAIIGATGSGKTTAMNLLMRFYDVTRGSVRVDGADVRDVKQADLRARIGFVPQKGYLLSGTVDFNIRYGAPDAAAETVREAAETAQALEFITEKEEAFEAGIAQGGTNMSGGQKQRISIARALARQPEILVFDDSFSALDFATDARLRRALKARTAQSAVIVVAQRVGTIMNAEQIIVLDAGRVAGKGTHAELLKTCPAYYEIASSQLSPEDIGETNPPERSVCS